jgi:hypothetical protein
VIVFTACSRWLRNESPVCDENMVYQNTSLHPTLISRTVLVKWVRILYRGLFLSFNPQPEAFQSYRNACVSGLNDRSIKRVRRISRIQFSGTTTRKPTTHCRTFSSAYCSG